MERNYACYDGVVYAHAPRRCRDWGWGVCLGVRADPQVEFRGCCLPYSRARNMLQMGLCCSKASSTPLKSARGCAVLPRRQRGAGTNKGTCACVRASLHVWFRCKLGAGGRGGESAWLARAPCGVLPSLACFCTPIGPAHTLHKDIQKHLENPQGDPPTPANSGRRSGEQCPANSGRLVRIDGHFSC